MPDAAITLEALG